MKRWVSVARRDQPHDVGLRHRPLWGLDDEPPICTESPLLGGESFDEHVVMWWNFIGRSHEDIVRLREEWNEAPDDRFGRVKGYRGAESWLAAPPLPDGVRLKARHRRGRG